MGSISLLQNVLGESETDLLLWLFLVDLGNNQTQILPHSPKNFWTQLGIVGFQRYQSYQNLLCPEYTF
jgi:hypothetical protein